MRLIFFFCLLSLAGCASTRIGIGLTYTGDAGESASIMLDGKTVRVRGGIEQGGRIVGAEVDFLLPRKRAGFSK